MCTKYDLSNFLIEPVFTMDRKNSFKYEFFLLLCLYITKMHLDVFYSCNLYKDLTSKIEGWNKFKNISSEI